ncbi:hypothetical protein ABZP36_032260 [Zizania latifolia]
MDRWEYGMPYCLISKSHHFGRPAGRSLFMLSLFYLAFTGGRLPPRDTQQLNISSRVKGTRAGTSLFLTREGQLRWRCSGGGGIYAAAAGSARRPRRVLRGGGGRFYATDTSRRPRLSSPAAKASLPPLIPGRRRVAPGRRHLAADSSSSSSPPICQQASKLLKIWD